MSRLAAVLLGLGSGLYFSALQRILASLFWPRLGGGLFLLALLGAAAGAAAAFLLAKGERKVGGGHPGWGHIFWGAASIVVLAALSTEIGGGWAGMPGEGPGIPVSLCFLLAAPPFLTMTLLFAGKDSRSTLRGAGLFLVALGAGVLFSSLVPGLHPRLLALTGVLIGILPPITGGAAVPRGERAGAGLLAAAALWLMVPSLTPLSYGTGRGGGPPSVTEVAWSGESRLEFPSGDVAGHRLTISGGLREILFGGEGKKELAVPLDGGADGRLEAVCVGFPDGAIVRRILSEGGEVLILERDPVLAREILRRSPQLREDPRVRVKTGDPRRFLAGHSRKFDLLVLGESPTPAAHLSSAWASREDYLATVEAFRVYAGSLHPRGLLFAERPATARVVTALREATADSEIPFADRVIVLGRRGRLTAQSYYRPAGFSPGDLVELNRHSLRRKVKIFTSPETRRKWNLYYSLVRGDLLQGYYFTSPQDLSPARDEQPFAWNLERLMISPSGPPLPEEEGHQPEKWRLRFIPPGDGIFWIVIAAGFLLLLILTLFPLAVFEHRTGLAGHALPYLWLFLLLGAASSAILRALCGWGRWVASPAGTATWLPGLFLAAAGAGWLIAPERRRAWKAAGFPLALLALCFAAAGYGLPSLREAPVAAGIVMAAALALGSGFGAGRLVGSCIGSADEVLPGTSSWFVSLLLLGGVTAWSVSGLAAAAFGFPALWMCAAAALLGASWSGRRL